MENWVIRNRKPKTGNVSGFLFPVSDYPVVPDNVLRDDEMRYLEVINIGHSIVARSVFVGLDGAIKEMMEKLSLYHEW